MSYVHTEDNVSHVKILFKMFEVYMQVHIYISCKRQDGPDFCSFVLAFLSDTAEDPL